MKCKHCGSEWNVSARLSVSVTNCPFCGKPLAKEIKTDSTEGVIAYIYRDYGEGELRDGKHLLAFFSDLAPEQKKERRILSHFVSCSGHTILLDVKKQNKDPKPPIERIVYKMTEELLLSETLSRQICEKYWLGIGGSPLSKDNNRTASETALPKEDSPVKKPVPAQETKKSAIDFGSQNPADFKIKGRTLVKYLGSSSNPRVPDGIRIIDKRAFYNKSVESVTLPDSLLKIKEEAFYFCTKLHTINLPPKLEVIGDGAFSYAEALKNVALPDSLVTLGTRAFSHTKIQSIRIPSKITTVPYEAFEYCRELVKVELCPGVEALVNNAFNFCPSLKSISIPDSLKQMIAYFSARRPFVGTDNITEVRASDRWKRNNPELLRYMIPAANEADNFEVEDNVLVHYYGRSSRPVIPARVIAIGERAFENNSHIQTIVIPEGVCTISHSAFFGCKKLASISLPRSLETIESYAFNATGLNYLALPPKVKTIKESAFGSCNQLREIIIPDSVANISPEAFKWCRNIVRINASEAWKWKNAGFVSAVLKKK